MLDLSGDLGWAGPPRCCRCTPRTSCDAVDAFGRRSSGVSCSWRFTVSAHRPLLQGRFDEPCCCPVAAFGLCIIVFGLSRSFIPSVIIPFGRGRQYQRCRSPCPVQTRTPDALRAGLRRQQRVFIECLTNSRLRERRGRPPRRTVARKGRGATLSVVLGDSGRSSSSAGSPASGPNCGGWDAWKCIEAAGGGRASSDFPFLGPAAFLIGPPTQARIMSGRKTNCEPFHARLRRRSWSFRLNSPTGSRLSRRADVGMVTPARRSRCRCLRGRWKI